MPSTLLLADDSVTIQRVIELTFANEDVRVVAVGDGQAAIQRIERERPDIVLADVGMPKLDGYGVASHVKQSPTLKNIPVLLLTGAFEPVDEGRARATGCDGILVKPFEPQHLIGRVKELLAGRKAADLWPTDMPRVDAPPPKKDPEPPPVAAAPKMAAAPPGPTVDVKYDHLDAALAQLEAGASPAKLDLNTAFGQAGEVTSPTFGDWDLPAAKGRPEPPVLDLQPAAPPAPPPAPADRRQPAASWLSQPPAPAPPAAQALPSGLAGTPAAGPRLSMSSAFSALLAAEQAQPTPQTVPAPSVSETDIEELVHKVVTKMTGDAVRSIVLETAERLIREEIEKIKAHPSEIR